MGGILSVNLGPDGEEYNYFSTCGPIVQGYPEPSLYHLAADTPGAIPAGCPSSVCVKAGQMDFGSKGEQLFAIGLVWFTLVSSIILWLFYTCVHDLTLFTQMVTFVNNNNPMMNTFCPKNLYSACLLVTCAGRTFNEIVTDVDSAEETALVYKGPHFA
jgi:hypothetical protein